MGKLLDMVTGFGAHVFKTHPKIGGFIILMCALTFAASMQVFAQKSVVETSSKQMQETFSGQIGQLQIKVDNLQDQFNNFSKSSERNFLLIQVGSMEREIYELEELVQSGQANQRDTDRLIRVRSEYNEALRKLNALPVP